MAVSGLSVNTKYYVVAVAENDDWIVTGGLVSFSTLCTAADPWRVGERHHLQVGDAALERRDVWPAGHGQRQCQDGIHVLGGPVTPFGPVSVTADGDVAIPLSALVPGTVYSWNAKATSIAVDSTFHDGPGTARDVPYRGADQDAQAHAHPGGRDLWQQRHDLRHDPRQAGAGRDAGRAGPIRSSGRSRRWPG